MDVLRFSRVGRARKLLKSIAGFSLTAVWAGFLLASLTCNAMGTTSSVEDRAQTLDKSFICPICPSETLDQSQVELAKQMRSLIRDKLSEGWTESEIKRFFVERYGEEILIVPEKRGINLIVWLVPLATIPIGLATLFVVLRLMTRRFARQQKSSRRYWNEEEQDMEKYLGLVDDERDH